MSTETESDEEEQVDVVRSAQEVARRSIVLHSLVSAAHGVDKQKLRAWLDAESLSAFISPEELGFLQSPEPSEQVVTNASWRVEALVTLAWAIGVIPDLDPLTNLCDTDRLIEGLPTLGAPTSDFIVGSAIRPEAELNLEYEKVYHSHWEVRDAQINGRKPPNKLNPSVVRERHYGFNWVIGYCGQEWDEITTDT